MLDLAHQHVVYGRRIRVLARHVADLLPRDVSVLDVGSGDGLLARRVMDLRPDVRVRGVDVMLRPSAHIPVERFDGIHLPAADREFDAVMMIDVLHHASDQTALLREIARVAKHAVIIKDHVVKGLFARQTLSFMDRVGNARHGVALPYSYWSADQWRDNVARAGLRERVRRNRLGLYPWPASLIFDRSLHFVAVLEPVSA